MIIKKYVFYTTMNTELIIASTCFLLFTVGAGVAMSYMTWKTLILGEWYLQGKGEPGKGDLNFKAFCRFLYLDSMTEIFKTIKL